MVQANSHDPAEIQRTIQSGALGDVGWRPGFGCRESSAFGAVCRRFAHQTRTKSAAICEPVTSVLRSRLQSENERRAVTASLVEIETIPKVELHVHLGGAITEATAIELAHRHGVDPLTALRLIDGRYPGRYRDFPHFLDTYLASNALVTTPDDLEFVAARFANQQAAEGIVWTEVIFTAMIYIRNGIEPEAMWRALRDGLQAGGPETRIGIVVDALCDFGRVEAEATIQLVEEADAPIVGLCLTGIEGTVPTTDFYLLREASTRLGLGFEVHAGEMGPPSSIVEALDVLGADRIGHGVAAIRDPELLAPARSDPGTSRCLSVVERGDRRVSVDRGPPAGRVLAGRVNLTISSDDPPFFRTTLTEELRHAVRVAELARRDLAELQRRAARNSFAPPRTRRWCLDRIDSWDNEATA